MASQKNAETAGQPHDLELFFDHSADLLCIAGFDGYFKKVNSALVKELGYSNEELLENPIDEFIIPEDRNLTRSFRNSIKDGIPLLNFENRYVTKPGDVIWLSWTSIPDNDRELVYAVAKNVTHHRRLSDYRNELLSNLTKANRDLKQLTYSTSHDLRSPLGNIIGILSLIDSSKIEDVETLKLIEMLNQSAENMRKTLDAQINSLRENENVVANSEFINLNECLSTVTNSIQSYIQTSGAKIDVSFDAFETVRFNKAFMESIFLNLITNSIRYSNPNKAPFITIQSKLEQGIKQVAFSDNGVGMDMDNVKGKIFGFNQTFHDHKESKGIGLYLVNNHVNAMGGSISVESEVGEGTTFTITFLESDER
ncbi:MAG: ATP-binding protein [Bacteroidota bacterium]